MGFFISKILIALILAGGVAWVIYFFFIKGDAPESKNETKDESEDQDHWQDF
ncbi:hypothetical protein [Enterococcus sp. AZ109]|uniref:hypothetical protein n=1 Tax=Enterococcus sp. AZ109 TaxID=2774634 RepID=UPI003F27D7CA